MNISKHLISTFYRNLATLLNAGTQLPKALHVLAHSQEHKSFKKVLFTLHHDIAHGALLSQALQKFPQIFPHTNTQLLNAAEHSGQLPASLLALHNASNQSLRIQKKLRQASLYPAITLTVAITILCGLITFVIPRFQSLYNDLHLQHALPLLTRFFITLSQNPAILAALIILPIAALIFSLRSSRLKNKLLNLPGLRRITHMRNRYVIAHALAQLLNAGIPITQALALTARAAPSSDFSSALLQSKTALERGSSLGSALALHPKLFPPLFTQMISTGEQSACLPDSLSELTTTSAEDLESTLQTFNTLIEPAFILILTAIVGSAIIALFLPLVGLLDSLVTL